VVSRALVLGSGGNTGFSWQWGVLASLHDVGVDLRGADLTVGTSAGSAAAVEFVGGADPHVLLDALANNRLPMERDAPVQPEGFGLADAITGNTSASAILTAIGALALTTGGSEARLRHAATSYLTVPEWPEQALVIPAVDVETGRRTIFSRDSGVDVIDAIAASCAVPGIWSPFPVNGRRYLDGSVLSSTNADLAAGHGRVLVIAPVNGIRGIPGASIDEALAPVKAEGEVFLVRPDAAAKAAIGTDLLDMTGRAAAAKAGLAQGAALAAEIKEFWNP
jgi:NTE family protein